MDAYNENSLDTPSQSMNVNPHQFVPKKKTSKASRSRTVDPSAKRRKDKSPSRKTARNNKDQVHERSIIEEHAYSM
jgi:hypothetical protein